MKKKEFGRPLRLLGSNEPAPTNHVRLESWLTPQRADPPYRDSWLKNMMFYLFHGLTFEEVRAAEEANRADPTIAHVNPEPVGISNTPQCGMVCPYPGGSFEAWLFETAEEERARFDAMCEQMRKIGRRLAEKFNRSIGETLARLWVDEFTPRPSGPPDYTRGIRSPDL